MSVFDSMKHAVHTVFKETVEAVTPVSNVSQFRDKGVLTPEEFVAAGDLLVFKCPSWTWEAGDPSKARDYLPKEKQYLVTRNVPCHRRADGLASSVREMQMEDAEDGEWTETQAVGGKAVGGAAGSADVEDIDDDEPDAPPAQAAAGGAGATMDVESEAAGKAEEEDVPDLDDLELEDEGGVMVPADPSALPTGGAAAAAGGGGEVREASSDFVRTRSYTVSITYDKYYQTPRMWLFGYDEDNKPLTHAQVFEDMSRDHAKKTVTIDPHPHMPSVSQASVHPCKHAPAMKRIIDQIESTGKTMRPDQAMFLFLKFISSVIPTVEYDFTMDFDT